MVGHGASDPTLLNLYCDENGSKRNHDICRRKRNRILEGWGIKPRGSVNPES
jgi:hypothetical protein